MVCFLTLSVAICRQLLEAGKIIWYTELGPLAISDVVPLVRSVTNFDPSFD